MEEHYEKNAVVGQSGGPTAVINASLYGTVYEALNREDEIGTVYGMINGIEGFLNDQVMDMAPLEESKELELIRTTPGSYLGSCRYKLPEDLNDPVYPQLLHASKHTTSDISSTSEAMIPWILSASFPAMPKRSAATSV